MVPGRGILDVTMTKKSDIGPTAEPGEETTTNAAPQAPTAWDNVPDMLGLPPWKRTGLSTADILHMLAKEAKASLYELLRAHVEYAYDRSGWPAAPKAWEPLERERDTVVGAAQLLPNERYGLTYGAARRQELSDGSYGPAMTLDGLTLPGYPTLNLLWSLWTENYFHNDPSNKMLPTLLVRYEYAEDLKEEIRTAFADFKHFKIGNGAGKDFMGRLGNDEQGLNAIKAWKEHREVFDRRIATLLNEPFGIERDFTYLCHTACWAFASVLLQQLEQQYPALGEMHRMNSLRQFYQRDTLGSAPVDTYNDACTGPDKTIVPFDFTRWITLYLERVEETAKRWSARGYLDVNDRLGALREQVRTWDRPAWGINALPRHRTEVEAAQLKVVEGIGKIKEVGTEEPSTSVPMKPQAQGEPAEPRTMGERLDAVQGARQAFDEMLRIDGFTNKDGGCVLMSRKGKGGILANWDAVVEHFAVEGFAHDRGLSEALCKYLPGLTIQKRIGKLREGNVYKDAFRSAQTHLKR